nr:hypothetical protein [Tanacetum cinerariifolium]
MTHQQEKVHRGIKVGANNRWEQTIGNRSTGQEGAEGNVAEKKKVKESVVLKSVAKEYGRKETRVSDSLPDLWIVVLRIDKLQGIGEFSGVGYGNQFTMSNRQLRMGYSSANDICKELASPKQTTLESLGEDASKQERIDDADTEVTFIDDTSNDARNKNNKISNIKRWKMTKKQ